MPTKMPIKSANTKKSIPANKTANKSTTFLSKLNFNKLTAIIFILVFAGIGSYMLIKSQASVIGAEAGITTGGDFQYLDSAEQGRQLDDMKALGVRWIRFDFAWTDIQNGGPTSFDWTRYDNTVSAINARGIKILGSLSYTPTWARPATCNTSDKCAPANPNDYANFARQAAARYGPMGVHHWEIWNEPNILPFWQPAPNVANYTALLKAAYPAIKQANPAAFVVTAGTSPAASNGTDIAPVDFLAGIYSNGGQGNFDAVGHHPYCFAGSSFNCPTAFTSWSSWSQMQDTNPSLRSVLIANGDSAKKIWATEFGAPTSGSGAVSEAQQAQMVTDSFNLFKSYEWAGPLFWYNYKDGCTDAANRECWFGLLRFDASKKQSYDSFKLASGGLSADTTPPTQPTNLTSPSQTTTSINLSWTASIDNVGITGYDIYRNNAKVGTAATTSYSDSGLTASTSYSYYVIARDAAGNSSPASVTFSATTLAVTPPATDTTAPTVNISSPVSGSSVGRSTAIKASATDNVGVTKMEIYADGKLLATSTTSSISTTWNTRRIASGAHTITVKAYDAAGNPGQSSITVYK